MIWKSTGWTEYQEQYGLTTKEMVKAVRAAGLPVASSEWTEAQMRHAEYVLDKAERAKAKGRTV